MTRVRVEQEIELAAGESTVSFDVMIPVYGSYYNLWWDIRVDGRHDKELSVDLNHHMQATLNYSGQMDESLLILDASSPSSLAGVVDPIRSMAQTLTALAQAAQPGLIDEPMVTVQQDLPERLLDYTQFDIVRIDAATLAEQMDKRPAAVKALVDWVAAGGNLWVVQVGTNGQKLNEVSGLLGMNSSEILTDPDPDLPVGEAGWQYLNLATLTTTLGSSQRAVAHGWREGLPTDPADESASAQNAQNVRPVSSSGWFAVQRLGWGMVAAMPRHWESPPRRISEDSRLHALAFWKQRGWVARHGLRPTSGNANFSSFLIPGVGLAPVVEFQVLITLFVIVIGPVNYWLLKRARKLHLMVLTVPAFALLVTGTLMLYGLMADGLGTRVRAMSITHLDETHERASTWSRLSYYAAIAPAGGLEFSNTTAIYPLYPSPEDGSAHDYRNSFLEMKWTGQTQQLTSGWLRSRTPTQYLVVEPQTTTAGLRLRKTKGLRGTNLLGARLELVLALDDQGQWYQATGIDPDQPLELKEVDASAAVASYRDAVRDREPAAPDAALAPSSWNNYSMRYSGYDEGGDFEMSLQTQLWKDLLGTEGTPALAMAPRRYIAVAHRAAVASLGLEDATEEASVHIILGNW